MPQPPQGVLKPFTFKFTVALVPPFMVAFMVALTVPPPVVALVVAPVVALVVLKPLVLKPFTVTVAPLWHGAMLQHMFQCFPQTVH